MLLADLLKSKSLDLLEVAVSCIHTLLCNADLQASGVSIVSIYIQYVYIWQVVSPYHRCRLCGGGLVDLFRVSLGGSCIRKKTEKWLCLFACRICWMGPCARIPCSSSWPSSTGRCRYIHENTHNVYHPPKKRHKKQKSANAQPLTTK